CQSTIGAPALNDSVGQGFYCSLYYQIFTISAFNETATIVTKTLTFIFWHCQQPLQGCLQRVAIFWLTEKAIVAMFDKIATTRHIGGYHRQSHGARLKQTSG